MNFSVRTYQNKRYKPINKLKKGSGNKLDTYTVNEKEQMIKTTSGLNFTGRR